MMHVMNIIIDCSKFSHSSGLKIGLHSQVDMCKAKYYSSLHDWAIYTNIMLQM